MQRTNTVVFLSDEHNRDVLGCYGDPIAKTPNLDRLAARGTCFANAYCNAPVCVPSRASFATGRYPHQIHAWDSTDPYTGVPKGWAHRLRDQGHRVTSIGKLHFQSAKHDNGFRPGTGAHVCPQRHRLAVEPSARAAGTPVSRREHGPADRAGRDRLYPV